MEDFRSLLMRTCIYHAEETLLALPRIISLITFLFSRFPLILTSRLLIRKDEHQISYLPFVSNAYRNEKLMKA